MKILLVGINFGNYENRIVETFKKQGHEIFYMYDTDKHYSFYLRLFGEKYTDKKTVKYQNKMLKEMPHNFDRVIVIVGRQLKVEFLEQVKINNPEAKFFLYLWDDVKRVENFEKTKEFYDEIYSFDLKDCRDYGFKHLPLFFTQRPKKNTNKKYDIYSAMFSHSERERIIDSVADQAEKMGKQCKFYISVGRFAYIKRRKELNNCKRENVIYISKPISEMDNYDNMEKSKTILDVQFCSQIGLTMRTIESIGMKNKLITTNPSIKYYDFYNSDNVFIIERKKPVIDKNFLEIPYRTIPKEIYEKYSLDTWVKTLTGEIVLNNYIGDYDINSLYFEGFDS